MAFKTSGRLPVMHTLAPSATKRSRDGRADAGAATRYQSYFALQLHGVPFFFSGWSLGDESYCSLGGSPSKPPLGLRNISPGLPGSGVSQSGQLWGKRRRACQWMAKSSAFTCG